MSVVCAAWGTYAIGLRRCTRIRGDRPATVCRRGSHYMATVAGSPSLVLREAESAVRARDGRSLLSEAQRFIQRSRLPPPDMVAGSAIHDGIVSVQDLLLVISNGGAMV